VATVPADVHRDVNACVRGLVAGGATNVLVNEAHASQRNLLLEDLDQRAGCSPAGTSRCR